MVEKTRERLVELVAESDDALMEKYFEQGTLEEADIIPNINKAIAQSKLCPVFAVSSATLVGLRALLNGIVDYAPDPAHHEAEYGFRWMPVRTQTKIARRYSESEPFSAYCFRTVADPFRRPHKRHENNQRSTANGRQRFEFNTRNNGTTRGFACSSRGSSSTKSPRPTPATSSPALN